MKKSLKYFWGTGDFGVSLINNVFRLYFIFFLTDLIRLPLTYVSFILIVTSVTDFIIAPICGGIIDGTKPMRWGRLRSWLLIGPIATLFVFPLMFLEAGNHFTNSAIIIGAFLLHKIIYNVTTIANLTLIPIMAKDENERITLNSNRMIGANAGQLIVGYITPLLLNGFLLVYFAPQLSYMLISIIACIAFIACYLVHFYLSKNAEKNNFSVPNKPKKDKLSVKEMLTALFKTPPLLPALIADISTTSCTLVLPSLAIFYYKNVVEQPALLAIHMLVIGIFGVIGSFGTRYIVKLFDVRTACLIVYPLVSAILFSTKFFAYDPVMFIVVNGILSLFLSTMQPMESNLYMDTITYSKWKTGIDAKGMIMSITKLPTKLSHIVKNLIIALTFLAVGYTAGATSPEVKEGIITAYCVIPAIVPLAGWIVLFFFYKLTPEKIRMMKEEIEKKEKI
ncbi:MFS transporter [Bacteroidia bacterium]|nr:MFS transporter [Bacteroidia bacterium]